MTEQFTGWSKGQKWLNTKASIPPGKGNLARGLADAIDFMDYSEEKATEIMNNRSKRWIDEVTDQRKKRDFLALTKLGLVLTPIACGLCGLVYYLIK